MEGKETPSFARVFVFSSISKPITGVGPGTLILKFNTSLSFVDFSYSDTKRAVLELQVLKNF